MSKFLEYLHEVRNVFFLTFMFPVDVTRWCCEQLMPSRPQTIAFIRSNSFSFFLSSGRAPTMQHIFFLCTCSYPFYEHFTFDIQFLTSSSCLSFLSSLFLSLFHSDHVLSSCERCFGSISLSLFVSRCLSLSLSLSLFLTLSLVSRTQKCVSCVNCNVAHAKKEWRETETRARIALGITLSTYVSR